MVFMPQRTIELCNHFKSSRGEICRCQGDLVAMDKLLNVQGNRRAAAAYLRQWLLGLLLAWFVASQMHGRGSFFL